MSKFVLFLGCVDVYFHNAVKRGNFIHLYDEEGMPVATIHDKSLKYWHTANGRITFRLVDITTSIKEVV